MHKGRERFQQVTFIGFHKIQRWKPIRCGN